MIPPVAHFIWLGPRLPWIFRLAIRSAALRGGFERVLLHHDHPLELGDLESAHVFEARPLRVDEVLGHRSVEFARLREIYAQLESFASRVNLLRLAILLREGGVYLDTDTVTVRSFDALRREAGIFCGEERVTLPYRVVRTRDPHVLLQAGLLMAVRDVARRLPEGWRAFRKIEARYHLAANNAVLGASKEHAFIQGLVAHIVQLPAEERTKRYRLGTHALQEYVRTYSGDDLVVHPPETFYPLGPEISEHWFRRCKRPKLDEVLSPTTHLVHWYASVRTRRIVPRVDANYVRDHRDNQLFSALVSSLLMDGDM